MRGTSLIVMAWRNLWRNRRRTLLTLWSIVFGVFLAVLFTALQDQNWADTIDLAARLSGGHVTLQHPEYLDTPKLTHTIQETDDLIVIKADGLKAVGAMMNAGFSFVLGEDDNSARIVFDSQDATSTLSLHMSEDNIFTISLETKDKKGMYEKVEEVITSVPCKIKNHVMIEFTEEGLVAKLFKVNE